MNNPFENVKDSSLWYRHSSLQAVEATNSLLYVGIIRSVSNDKETNELLYLVEVKHRNDIVLTYCRMVRSLGGVFNYEDVVMRGYSFNSASTSQNSTMVKAGDVVLVGQLAGQGREGVILGALTHPARKSFLDTTKGPQYRSEFNGVETYINSDGEYTLTFKGQPTNLAVLNSAPDKPIVAPQYDTKVGSSFLRFDKTGSFLVSDNASSDPQFFKLDKTAGTATLTSGKVSMMLSKHDQMIKMDTASLIVGNSNTEIVLSDGKMGAARINDTCGFALIAGPYTVTGTIWINQGSKKVVIG